MRRPVLLIVGVLLAFAASSLVLAAGLVVEVMLTPARTSVALFDAMALIFANGIAGSTGALVAMSVRAIWSALVTVCFVPIALVAAIAEVVQSRSLLLIAGSAGLLTAALPTLLQVAHRSAAEAGLAAGEGRLLALLFLTGATAGTVFWLVNGAPGHAAA